MRDLLARARGLRGRRGGHRAHRGDRAAGGRLPGQRRARRGGAAVLLERVRGAAKYEFQLSADSAFRSIVDRGSFETRNTFATIEDTLADGNYYWRTRALDSRDRAGSWSGTRSVVKRWSNRAALLSPANGASVAYPGTPLVLRWQPVPYAHKYLVAIGTDPSLATQLVGNGGRPIETQGTAFAVPDVLAPGTRYYWQITPLDSAGHRGAASSAHSFVWGWDSSTSPDVKARTLRPAF